LSSGTDSLFVMRNSPWKQQAFHALTVTNVAVIPGVTVVSVGVEIDGFFVLAPFIFAFQALK